MRTETVDMWFGSVTRLAGEYDSEVLTQLPYGVYPDPPPACASCPGKDWYLTAKELRCYCSARGIISWVSNDAPVMICDARERLIADLENRGEADQAD